MKDRFADFQKTIDHFDEVELGTVRPPSTSNKLADSIREVRSEVISLENEVKQLQRQQNHVLSSLEVNINDKKNLENQISVIRRRVGQIRKSVKEVEDEFTEFSRTCPSKTHAQIQQNQIDDLRKRLLRVMEEFNGSQADYRNRVSVRVRRQLAAVGEDVSQEEVDKMLTERGQDLIFFRQINPLSITGKAAVDDVKQRHDEIMKLEESIVELHDCYVDLQNLVAMQGDVVDNIAKNTEETAVYIGTGATQVKQAVEYKKAAMRKKICVIGGLLIVLLILIAVAIILAIVLSGKK